MLTRVGEEINNLRQEKVGAMVVEGGQVGGQGCASGAT